MRAIADAREVIAEFKINRRTYRLILPTGRNTFELERLARDEWRPHIGRWRPFGVGAYRDTTVISSIRDVGRPFPPEVTAAVALAISYVVNGPTHRRKFHA